MKLLSRVLAVAIILVSTSALAGTFDGVYGFSGRTKTGNPDMAGWWGMMVIEKGTMTRVYHSPDGTTEKYYVGDLKKVGDLYTIKFTQAYKPSYVGNEHKNKITLSGTKLLIESPDGTFTETWGRK